MPFCMSTLTKVSWCSSYTCPATTMVSLLTPLHRGVISCTTGSKCCCKLSRMLHAVNNHMGHPCQSNFLPMSKSHFVAMSFISCRSMSTTAPTACNGHMSCASQHASCASTRRDISPTWTSSKTTPGANPIRPRRFAGPSVTGTFCLTSRASSLSYPVFGIMAVSQCCSAVRMAASVPSWSFGASWGLPMDVCVVRNARPTWVIMVLP